MRSRDPDNDMALLQIENFAGLKEAHREWIEETLNTSKVVRESKWTQSIASEISRFLTKSKIASEYGQKAVRFMEAKMSISYVKDRLIMAVGRIWIMKIHSIGI